MNIAFLAPYAPTRLRTRSFHFLKTLAEQGHQIALFTVWSDQTERACLAHIEQFGIRVIAAPLTRQRALWNSLRALPTTTPLQACYSWEPKLARLWSDALAREKFDVAHIEHLRGARYARAAHAQTRAVVWDSVDCISKLFEQTRAKSANRWSRFISDLEYPRTRAYEAALAREMPHTIVVADAERDALLALNPAAEKSIAQRTHVVPNGIDTKFFARRGAAHEPATIVFSGKMSYHANLTAALFLLDEIMPLVWRRAPQTQVLIVGANPPAKLRARAEAAQAKIIVTGSVTDIRPFLERATVAIAPMVYAAGMQNKVLEAMAMETPVIATPDAIASIGARAGQDIIIANGAAEFANRIVEILNAPARQRMLAANGRALVETQLSWRASVDKLLDIYARARKNARAA